MRALLLGITFTLVLILGLPIDPLEKASEQSYQFLRHFGLTVGMTPFTVDMSMMDLSETTPLYQKQMQIDVHYAEKKYTLPPRRLELYKHKVPLILYFELLSYGIEAIEAKTALCHQFSQLIESPIDSFTVKINNGIDFQKVSLCHE